MQLAAIASRCNWPPLQCICMWLVLTAAVVLMRPVQVAALVGGGETVESLTRRVEELARLH